MNVQTYSHLNASKRGASSSNIKENNCEEVRKRLDDVIEASTTNLLDGTVLLTRVTHGDCGLICLYAKKI